MTSPLSTAHVRRFGLTLSLWLFGLATTVFLIGMWGRSVSTDQSALEAAFDAVAEADAIAERIEGWVNDGLTLSAGLQQPGAPTVALSLGQSAASEDVVDGIVAAVVDAALEVPGANPAADIRLALERLKPVIAAEMGGAGRVYDEALTDRVLDQVAMIVADTESQLGLSRSATEAARLFSQAAVVSLLALLSAGGVAIFLTEDRLRMLRTLASRIAVSGFTFAIILQVGAWAVDPGGGRAPIAAGGAVLLRSNSAILIRMGGVAVIMAVVLSAALAVRRRRRIAVAVNG